MAGRWICRWWLVWAFAVVCMGCSGQDLDRSTELRVAAHEAITQGDKQLAIQKLTESLEIRPDAGAYLQRARLYAETERDDLARSDCEKGLELAPNDENLKWLLDQLKRPADSRFRGETAQPPGHSK